MLKLVVYEKNRMYNSAMVNNPRVAVKRQSHETIVVKFSGDHINYVHVLLYNQASDVVDKIEEMIMTGKNVTVGILDGYMWACQGFEATHVMGTCVKRKKEEYEQEEK